MDYKEKLKAIINSNKTPFVDIDTFLKYFPELKESEDERIRKEIIDFVKSRGGFKGDWITWLEKQGEQSPKNTNKECLKGIKRVQEYQDLSDWEKKFDNIASMYAHNKNQEGYNESWYVKERAAAMLYHAKKELEKQGEQKPAEWSEEDEENFARVDYACLKTYGGDSYSSDWLRKFLGIHKKWKPSDKQMNALEHYMNTLVCNEHKEILFGLYTDLKKLKG